MYIEKGEVLWSILRKLRWSYPGQGFGEVHRLIQPALLFLVKLLQQNRWFRGQTSIKTSRAYPLSGLIDLLHRRTSWNARVPTPPWYPVRFSDVTAFYSVYFHCLMESGKRQSLLFIRRRLFQLELSSLGELAFIAGVIYSPIQQWRSRLFETMWTYLPYKSIHCPRNNVYYIMIIRSLQLKQWTNIINVCLT